MNILMLLVGLGTLIVGAEALVRGGSRLAARFGVPPLIVGLTVAAYGTGSPEMAVSLRAALAGQADIAVGNIAGSNILNVLVVLGVAALLRPLAVDTRLVRRDVPVLIAASALFLVLSLDGSLGRLDGVLLALGGAGYTILVVRGASRHPRRSAPGYPGPRSLAGGPFLSAAFVLAGLALLVLGAHWLVTAAVAIARSLGVSELLIGLSIVAVGTSLPELATSIVAAFRGERDIAVGNVVGSGIFNILIVLGVSALLSPARIGIATSALRFDIPLALAAAVVCLPVFFTGHTISRWEGGLFLGSYVLYAWLLGLRAAGAGDRSVLVFGLVVGGVVLAAVVWMLARLALRRGVS
ncbi:MAG: calcium/sodium antiporter [Candidatus Eisenbacteria bacterium]